jgi:hypothetical protein
MFLDLDVCLRYQGKPIWRDEREERIIGMQGSVKHAEREVQFSHLPGFQVTSDAIPQAAVCTLFP